MTPFHSLDIKFLWCRLNVGSISYAAWHVTRSLGLCDKELFGLAADNYALVLVRGVLSGFEPLSSRISIGDDEEPSTDECRY